MILGQLSEEALEARHKECRVFRQHNARKSSRKNNIGDLLHALLLSSDPVISDSPSFVQNSGDIDSSSDSETECS